MENVEIVRITSEMEQFLNPNFDAIEFSREIVKPGETEKTLKNLEELSESVTKAIDAHVAANGDVLLGRLEKAGELQSTLESLQSNTGTLVEALRRVQQDVSDPFYSMKVKVQQLENVQSAAGLLQKVSWFLQAVKRVRQQLERPSTSSTKTTSGSGNQTQTVVPTGVRELAKVSQLMQEVERLLYQEHMDRIATIQSDRRWAIETIKEIRSNAQVALQNAVMAYPNQTEVHAALQSFYHLRCLPQVVFDVAVWAADMAARDVSNWLNVHQLRDAIENGTNAVEKPSTGAGKCGLGSPVYEIVKDRLMANRNNSLKVRSMVTPPASGAARKTWITATWGRVKQLQPALLHWCLRIWNLQRLLNKIPDPLNTGSVYDDIVMQDTQSLDDAIRAIVDVANAFQVRGKSGSFEFAWTHGPKEGVVYNVFWNALLVALSRQFTAVAAEATSPFVNQVLTADYSRLRRSLRQVLDRLAAHTGNKQGTQVGASAAEAEAFLQTTESFLAVYVDKSWGRLSDLLDRMFPKGLQNGVAPTPLKDLPTKADVKRFADAILKELVAANDDTALVVLLCGGAKNAILSFASKAEALVVVHPAAFRFAQPRSPAQQHNAALLDLALQLSALLGNLPLTMRSQARQRPPPLQGTEQDSVESAIERTLAAVRPATRALDALSDLIAGDYLAAAASCLGAVLAKVHHESFAEAVGGGEPSAYMAEFREAAARVAQEHLALLPAHPKVAEARSALLQRVVVLFLRNISCVRPLGEGGRMRMARDLAEFELAVLPLSSDGSLESLGSLYRELRAYRKLLFTDLVKVDTVLALAQELRPSHIWHYLFSSAPDLMRSPHDESGLALAAYFDALDEAEWRSDRDTEGSPAGLELLACGTRWPAPGSSAWAAEGKCWEMVERSLEKYNQRVSAASPTKRPGHVEEDPLAGLSDCYHLCYALRNECL